MKTENSKERCRDDCVVTQLSLFSNISSDTITSKSEYLVEYIIDCRSNLCGSILVCTNSIRLFKNEKASKI